MKLPFRQIEPFIKNPDPAARVILIYGPDSGLMRERGKAIGLTVVKDLHDPFNVTVLSSDIIADDPARLNDEANAISMLGGTRLIRVENASDKITTAVKDYLTSPNPNALLILEAGELTPRSSLRMLCEKSPAAAALPCYVEDERDLARFIRETLHAEKITADNDAVTWLAASIVGDRGRARAEIEKLIIYKGSDKTPVTLEDAQASSGDSGEQNLDELIHAVGLRNTSKALAVYNRLIDQDVSFIAILRALQNHVRRLHVTKAKIASGDNVELAMKSLQPPVFFKQESAFRAQVQNWSLPALEKTMARLMDLEAQCKQTAMPAETLCAQAVLSLSAARN